VTDRSIADLYLDLLEQTLTGIILDDPGYTPAFDHGAPAPFDPAVRSRGGDWPLHAQAMVVLLRLRNLRECIARVIADRIPGDFIETGVWRGGACIYMRANLAVHGDKERKVWVADSFAGLPPPDKENYPVDQDDQLHTIKQLAIPLEEVKANCAKYNMLDDRVVFLKGFFKDTLPTAPIGQLAIARLDGDMYESTIQALDALYHKLSPGGFLIVDDYALPNCRQAVHDFRGTHGISEKIEKIDDFAVFWRRAT
jgi:hypothetical protein